VIAVAETAPLRVQLIAKTEFFGPPDVPWTTDADGGHNQAVQKTFEQTSVAWIGSLRRGEPLTGKPDGTAQGM
jgi:hypothetical protein